MGKTAARGIPFRMTILLIAISHSTDGRAAPFGQQTSGCSPTHDAQHVNRYDGTLGPSVDYVRAHKRSKGALERTATDDRSAKYCSGSLISSDLFLTAGHCVDRSTVGGFVAFDYERAATAGAVLRQTHVRIVEVVEDELGNVDYAILRLAGTPGDRWGISAVAGDDPEVGTPIAIIGHPRSEPKQIEAGAIAGFVGNHMQYADLDTLAGSSGSGILDSSGQIVGVHTNGSCRGSGTSSGVRISKIRAVSNVL